MGLDMYLHARRYLDEYQPEEKALAEEVSKIVGSPKARVNYVTLEAGYWRKANHIHQWFVENVQGGKDDCREYYVPRKQLQELLDTCLEVKANPEKAEDLLPTASGFFFGGTAYDEYYMSAIDNTIAQLSDALTLPDVWDFEYLASW